MQPQQVPVWMSVEQWRKLSTILQAMIKVDDAISAEEARKGIVREEVRYAQHSEDCSVMLEAIELGIASRPLPLYVFDEAMVVRVPLSRDESERLLRAAGDHRDPVFDARNRAIVSLLLEGALRRSRFNPLMEDLQLDEGYVVIRDTKNKYDWKVNLAPVAVEAL